MVRAVRAARGGDSVRAIVVDSVARELAASVLTPTRPMARPMYQWLRFFTAGLMPESLRRDFDLPTGRRVDLALRTSLAGLRHGLPRLPDGVRYCPAYLRAQRRLSGRPGGDPLSDIWRRIILGMLKQPES